MEILILTEGGEGIGMGHISRCTALADGFISIGHRVQMLIRGAFSDAFNTDGKYNITKTDWFEESVLNDLTSKYEIIVTDSYLAPENILKYIAERTKLPVFLVDSKLKYFPKGAVLFPSIYANDFASEFPKEISILYGKEFLLFNSFMWNLPKYKVNKDVNTIGISLGAYLNSQTGNSICDAIQIAYPYSEILIFGQIDETTFAQTNAFKVLGFLEKKEYINSLFDIDILITNGGQSLNEALLVGVPCITITMADNQKRNASAWDALGITENIQYNSKSFKNQLIDVLNDYNTYNCRNKLNNKVDKALNAEGAVNAAKRIVNLLNQQQNDKK